MSKIEKIHFIAIGGSIMHNLAIALKQKGYEVTGSDDEIFEPSRSKLNRNDLLPTEFGWHPEFITHDLDAVVLGMHARKDNPELKRAQELGIKIFSFPEYLYEQSINKKRVVIAGSHGKTTITSMIMHVLNYNNVDFDYAVGAALAGFENSVRLSDAPIIIIEGDEYLSSPLDMTCKFFKYKHHIGLISGVAWDHMNVFPTEEFYNEQFQLFADLTPSDGYLTYYNNDEIAKKVAESNSNGATTISYDVHPYTIENNITYLLTDTGNKPLKVFGEHNLQNISGAKNVLAQLGVTDNQFYSAIQSFEGANLRLDLLGSNESTVIYKDFAHAPSKVLATTTAFKQQYENRNLVACLELHTFSSLNKTFIGQYKGALAAADVKVVFFNPKTVAHKRLPELTIDDIKEAFNEDDLLVYNSSEEMKNQLLTKDWDNTNLLLMSSGNFDNLDLKSLSDEILSLTIER